MCFLTFLSKYQLPNIWNLFLNTWKFPELKLTCWARFSGFISNPSYQGCVHTSVKIRMILPGFSWPEQVPHQKQAILILIFQSYHYNLFILLNSI